MRTINALLLITLLVNSLAFSQVLPTSNVILKAKSSIHLGLTWSTNCELSYDANVEKGEELFGFGYFKCDQTTAFYKVIYKGKSYWSYVGDTEITPSNASILENSDSLMVEKLRTRALKTYVSSMSNTNFRQDSQKPQIIKTNAALSSAVGWKKNQYGEWVSRKNKIPFDIEHQFKKIENFEANSLGDYRENFISWQLKDIKIKDTTYAVLIKKYRDGYYKYETIQEGWVPSSSYSFYVFKKEQLDTLKKVSPYVLSSPRIEVAYSDDIKYVDVTKVTDATLIKDINKKVLNPSIIDKKYLFITVRPDPKNKKMHFMISPEFYDFEYDMYYEVDEALFRSFLALNNFK